MDSQHIARLLPGVFQRTLPSTLPEAQSPLAALLTVMAALHEPPEAALSALERYFDAYTAPDAWVYYLASWLDLDPLYVESSLRTDYAYAPGVGRLRVLLLAALHLANRRGTYRGLRQFLQVALGFEEFDVREANHLPFHIQVYYPRAAAVYLPLMHRIVQMEKPAYVTYELIERADALPPQVAAGADQPAAAPAVTVVQPPPEYYQPSAPATQKDHGE